MGGGPHSSEGKNKRVQSRRRGPVAAFLSSSTPCSTSTSFFFFFFFFFLFFKLQLYLHKNREQLVYKFSAIAATVGIVALAAFAVHARFSWMREEGDVPATEAAATMLLALGGMVRSSALFLGSFFSLLGFDFSFHRGEEGEGAAKSFEMRR